MEINNIDKIKSILFKNPINKGSFAFIQVIQRRKENKDCKKNSKVIKSFYIFSEKELDESYEFIKLLCKQYKARAYVNVNLRSDKSICFQMMSNLCENLKSENYSFKNLVDTACGQVRDNSYPKKWIVDIDDKTGDLLELTKNRIENMTGESCEVVETLNGYHIISKPFDLIKFNKDFPNIDIHKDNATILYFNDNE